MCLEKFEKASWKTLANSADFLKSASFVRKELPAPWVFKRINRYPAAEQWSNIYRLVILFTHLLMTSPFKPLYVAAASFNWFRWNLQGLLSGVNTEFHLYFLRDRQFFLSRRFQPLGTTALPTRQSSPTAWWNREQRQAEWLAGQVDHALSHSLPGWGHLFSQVVISCYRRSAQSTWSHFRSCRIFPGRGRWGYFLPHIFRFFCLVFPISHSYIIVSLFLKFISQWFEDMDRKPKLGFVN